MNVAVGWMADMGEEGFHAVVVCVVAGDDASSVQVRF